MRQVHRPTPETMAEGQVLYLFDYGTYGGRSQWTTRRGRVEGVSEDRSTVSCFVSANDTRTPSGFKWTGDAYVPIGRRFSGELRLATDPEVIETRKRNVVRWLRSQTGAIELDESPETYVTRVREAAERAGTRLLRIEEGL